MSTRALQSPAHGAERSIAVVDDDASFLRSVGRLLHAAGYAVKTYASARDFLVSLEASSPGCLILDVHMPGMTGLELQDWLTDHGYRVPIILVTAYDTPKTRDYAQRAGSYGLLLKPFDKSALLSAIDKALGGSPPGFEFGDPSRPIPQASR